MAAQYGFQCTTPTAWTVCVTHIFSLLRMSSPTPALGVATFQHMDPTSDHFGKQCCSTSAYRSTIRFRTVRFRTVRNRTFQRIERRGVYRSPFSSLCVSGTLGSVRPGGPRIPNCCFGLTCPFKTLIVSSICLICASRALFLS